MAVINIALSEEGFLRLKELAQEVNLEPEELLRASVEEWLGRPNDDFARAATYVLQKNEDLYRRLA